MEHPERFSVSLTDDGQYRLLIEARWRKQDSNPRYPGHRELLRALAHVLVVQLVPLAARHTVPAIYEWREFAVAGGLASYGPSLTAAYRAFAVLRLTTSSNLVGCWTGRSAGLAPLRIFPA